MWNEVVDITSRSVALGAAKSSTVLVLEVVGEPPLLIVLGGPFTESRSTQTLYDALRDTWLQIWCRRARACLLRDHRLTLGVATLTGQGLTIQDLALPWAAVLGVQSVTSPAASLGIEGQGAADLLKTSSGLVEVPLGGAAAPFPSVAHRVAALAADLPTRPLLCADVGAQQQPSEPAK